MAITQDRLISLLDIIDGIRVRHKALHEFLERQRPIFNSARDVDTLLELYSGLRAAIQSTITLTPDEVETFARERAHFLHSAAKNRTTAQNARRYRAKERLRRGELTSSEISDALNLSLPTTLPAADLTHDTNSTPTNERPQVKPLTTERHTYLDTLNLQILYDRLKTIHDDTNKNPSALDIRDLYIRYGASEAEAEERAMYWRSQFFLHGVGRATTDPFEIKLLPWTDGATA